MFDIGWSELLFLGVLAILVVGPKDLPRMMRTIGQYTGKIKAAAREFQRSFDEMARESELEELRKQIADAKANNPVAQVKEAMAHPLDAVERALKETDTSTSALATPAEGLSPVTGVAHSIRAGGDEAKSDEASPQATPERAPKGAAQ